MRAVTARAYKDGHYPKMRASRSDAYLEETRRQRPRAVSATRRTDDLHA